MRRIRRTVTFTTAKVNAVDITAEVPVVVEIGELKAIGNLTGRQLQRLAEKIPEYKNQGQLVISGITQRDEVYVMDADKFVELATKVDADDVSEEDDVEE